MPEFRFDKLVRDGIADNIIKNGGKVNSRILSDNELLDEARKKLLEEAKELQTAKLEDIDGELSDILELIGLVCELRGITLTELAKIKTQKVNKVGSFERKIYIETAEIPEDSEWINYFLSQPEKYPEVK